MIKKTCTKCKKEKSIFCFYKYKSRSGHRPNCRDCYNAWSREYGKNPDVRKRRNLKGDTWGRKNLKSWEGHIPILTECQVCGVSIGLNSKNINTSIHFDHKTENCSIVGSPIRWLLKHPYSDENKKIWDECDFGLLCGVCNRAIPTKSRKTWLEQVSKYVGKNS